ncbi:PKD domain-containing protein [Myroides indicus]|uniref:Putative secreted protein (Por secretion system target) n=1 Tax=Myroides indicus TaxID=1323422 RepID=A0A4R7F7R0_9FLAO|nr:PKD domain-containing protein [Myroides indicus]TDS64254.1 putative secreted protein (Por secretion system target) [Myroides indicus]
MTICIEKTINPTAEFKFDGPEPGQKSFCTFSPISFNNLSVDNGGSPIVNYLWDFGDGTTSSLFEPTHAYDHPGVYLITLTVTNSCNCSSTYSWEVNIANALEFEVSCPSVVCHGAHETYSVTDGCGGEWRVEGGTIIAEHGTSVEVVWDHVDPEDGFGYVYYLSHCSCPHWTTVKIPVILDTAIIKGSDIVCQDGQGRFKLPQWPATDFKWKIDGDPNHPMLVYTDQRNEIVVDGAMPGNYVLSVEYNNTLIDDGFCIGNADIPFSVLERPEIITGDELTNCQGATMSFETHNAVSVRWQILLDGNVVQTSIGTLITHSFNTPGTYVITADYGGCMADPLTVEIVETPVITGTIDGPDHVCIDTPYTYTLSEEEPGFIYLWSVDNGEVIGDNSGAQADIQFTSTPATVSVVKQIVKNGKTCSSDPVEFTVNEAVINPYIINDSGQAAFCSSSSATFTVDLEGIVPDLVSWSILSSTGADNFGSIIDGIHDHTVTVSFNEISTSATGILQVEVVKCGVIFTQTRTIQLINNPVVTIGSIPDICPAAGSVHIPITMTPPAPAQVRVLIDGVYQNTYSYTGSGSLTINNNFTNNTSNNISRTIELELEVCSNRVSASKTAIVFPKTELYISPLYSYVVCPQEYGSINLSATVSTGITASMIFKWFKGTTLLQSSTSPNYTIIGLNPGGSYSLEVTDKNGCLVKSDNILVTESCGGSPGPDGCTVSPNPNASVSAEWTGCNQITAELDADYPPTSISWAGSEHLTVTGGQGTDTATFTGTVPGAHAVTAYLDYDGCTLIRTYTVEKKYEAKLETAISCNGDGTYKVVLHNNTLTYNIPLSTLSYAYSGPGVSAGASGNSTTISSIGPGTYTYTMKVNSTQGTPECETSVTVTLEPEPDPNFTLSPLNYCSEEVITLTTPDYNPNNTYEWSFNGTSFITKEEHTPVQFAKPDDYQVSLKVTTLYGCTYTSTNTVEVIINETDLSTGTILPVNPDYCDGNATPLTYESPLGSTPPADVIWMRGDQQVGTGMTYQPVQSGSYWVVLVDDKGCKNYEMVFYPKNYVLRQPPFAIINGNTSVCYGGGTVLVGITTDNVVEHRWSGPALPAGYNTWVSGSTNMTLTLNGLSPGTYNYTFHTRAASDPLCTNSFTATVEVHPPVTQPAISYTVINCDPYTIRLTATGPVTGVYNWSNGMTGKVIEVTHGGAYSVTYTETSGCSAVGYLQVPHNPNRALWVVPDGCYTVCDAYLLGPLGVYENYKWEVNGAVTQSGTYFIPNQSVNTGGIYQLTVTQDGCTFGSNTPSIMFDLDRCPPNDCGFEPHFERMEIIPGGIKYYVQMNNPTGSPVTVHLNSANAYGTFVPSVLVLNPGFNSFVVDFYVSGAYMPGAPDLFVVSGPNCADTVPVELPDIYSKTTTNVATQAASLILSPNPASQNTVLTFSTGTKYKNADVIAVYDLLGVQRYKQKVSGKTGEITLDISHFAPGTYIVILEADGKRIATEKLIKK